MVNFLSPECIDKLGTIAIGVGAFVYGRHEEGLTKMVEGAVGIGTYAAGKAIKKLKNEDETARAVFIEVQERLKGRADLLGDIDEIVALNVGSELERLLDRMDFPITDLRVIAARGGTEENLYEALANHILDGLATESPTLCDGVHRPIALYVLSEAVKAGVHSSQNIGIDIKIALGNRAIADIRLEGEKTREHVTSEAAKIIENQNSGFNAILEQLQLNQIDKTELVELTNRLKADLGTTTSLIIGFLKIILEKEYSAEQIPAALIEAAQSWKSAGEKLGALDTSKNLSPQIANLKESAQTAYAQENPEELWNLFGQIEVIETENYEKLLAHKHEVDAELELRRESLLGTIDAKTDLAKSRMRAQDVAKEIVRKIEINNPIQSEHFQKIEEIFGEYYRNGNEKGINFDLEIAIELAKAQFRMEKSEREKGWSQYNLGTALRTAGVRESGSKRLIEAVTACTASLLEITRERDPTKWAMFQNNLGNALYELGVRESATTRLDEAVEAYRNALLECTREKFPLQCAMIQMNLVSVLRELGEREGGTARLDEAVGVCRLALSEQTREKVPRHWALIQMNLGNLLFTLGERESGTERLEGAVGAYSAALLERTRESIPLDWAMTQNNLGNALSRLGERESGNARLKEAVDAYRAALLEYTRERVPLQWAMTQLNLGNALSALGKREPETSGLDEALSAYQAALLEITRERVPLQWAMTLNNLGNVLKALGKRESGTARLEQAIKAFHDALLEYVREKVPIDWAMANGNRADCEALVASLTHDCPRLRQAIADLRIVIGVLEQANHQAYLTIFRDSLAGATALIPIICTNGSETN